MTVATTKTATGSSKARIGNYCHLLLFLLAMVLFDVAIPVAAQQAAAEGAHDVPKADAASETFEDKKDWFRALDTNKDNVLDRREYELGMAKLRGFLQRPLTLEQEQSLLSSSSSSFSNSGWGWPWSWSTSLLSSFSFLNWDGFTSAFTSSVAMILATEVGDKTFFIAAVLSMQHDRRAVLLGALAALYIMTVLSCFLGVLLPNVLPREYTHVLGGLLFLYFGVKLIGESRNLEAGKASDELEEVEEELLQNQKKDEETDEEMGGRGSGGVEDANGKGRKLSSLSGGGRGGMAGRWKSNNKSWYRVAVQSFTLTFLAEWGDRSQIATIALGAHKNPIGVTVGGCLGHTICTGLAVVGGRMLAARISEKTVHQWGGVIFLIFGLHSLFFEE
jgi:putative Ca2+/H+ antiporter (TMEM165/GDT1 family)